MRWKTPLLRPLLKRSVRKRPVTRNQGLFLEHLESRLSPSATVLTYHNDTASTGANSTENQLTPTHAQANSFDNKVPFSPAAHIHPHPPTETCVNNTTEPHRSTDT